MDSLPIEIVEKILGWLCPTDLAKCCLISKWWRKMINNNVLWKKHVLTDFPREVGVPINLENHGILDEECEYKTLYARGYRMLKKWEEAEYCRQLDRIQEIPSSLLNGGVLMTLMTNGDLCMYNFNNNTSVQSVDENLRGTFINSIKTSSNYIVAVSRRWLACYSLSQREIHFLYFLFIDSEKFSPHMAMKVNKINHSVTAQFKNVGLVENILYISLFNCSSVLVWSLENAECKFSLQDINGHSLIFTKYNVFEKKPLEINALDKEGSVKFSIPICLTVISKFIETDLAVVLQSGDIVNVWNKNEKALCRRINGVVDVAPHPTLPWICYHYCEEYPHEKIILMDMLTGLIVWTQPIEEAKRLKIIDPHFLIIYTTYLKPLVQLMQWSTGQRLYEISFETVSFYVSTEEFDDYSDYLEFYS